MNAILRLLSPRRMPGFILILLLALFFSWLPSVAVEPDEILKDPELEQRARKLSVQLRCVVCQNQSIDDSNAPLARDLRLLVRERLKAGDSDAAVMDYIVARYGEFVLLRPPFGWHTLLLWFSPLLFLTVGIVLARVAMVRAKGQRAQMKAVMLEQALSRSEKDRLDELLSVESQDR